MEATLLRRTLSAVNHDIEDSRGTAWNTQHSGRLASAFLNIRFAGVKIHEARSNICYLRIQDVESQMYFMLLDIQNSIKYYEQFTRSLNFGQG